MDIESNEEDKIKGHSAVPIPLSAKWGTRHRLILNAFFMCMLLYSLRFNLSIAIVAMVDETATASSETEPLRKHADICPSLVEEPLNYTSVVTFANASTADSKSYRLYNNENENEPQNKGEKFRWNEKDQGLILGSFFWGYMASQFPAGLLAFKFGGKWVASLGMIWLALFAIALPQAALTGGRDLVVLVRVLQGLSSGFVVPALVVLLAKWTPPEERARLSAMCMSGLPLGTALTMIISGYLIPAYGWPSVFYVPGLLTILWFIVWTATVHSTPDDDPNISDEELKYLTSSLSTDSPCKENCSVKKYQSPPATTTESMNISEIPWKEIFTSLPIWAAFTSQFCSAWGHNMLKSEGPKYLHSALHFDIHANSYLSACPYLSQFLFMLIVGRLSDYLIENKHMSIMTARKTCNTIGQWGAAILFAGVICAGCNSIVATLCYIFAGMINGAMVCGAYVNIIDISPRYAGTIEGVINAFANIAGFGAPYIAGLILFHEPSILGWNYVFLVPVIANVIGNLVFLLGASVEVQPWNSQKNCDKSKYAKH